MVLENTFEIKCTNENAEEDCILLSRDTHKRLAIMHEKKISALGQEVKFDPVPATSHRWRTKEIYSKRNVKKRIKNIKEEEVELLRTGYVQELKRNIHRYPEGRVNLWKHQLKRKKKWPKRNQTITRTDMIVKQYQTKHAERPGLEHESNTRQTKILPSPESSSKSTRHTLKQTRHKVKYKKNSKLEK